MFLRLCRYLMHKYHRIRFIYVLLAILIIFVGRFIVVISTAPYFLFIRRIDATKKVLIFYDRFLDFMSYEF